MKPIKLTSLLLMLLVASTAFGQEVFYDDVYFSGKKEKKEQKEEKKVVEPQKQTQRTATAGGDTEGKHEKSDSFCRRNLPGTDRQPEKYGKQYKWLQRRLPAGEFPVAGSDRLSGKSVQSWNLRKP